MAFTVGMKVVCVDDTPNHWDHQYLKHGCVYQVVWAGEADSIWDDRQPAIRVAEISRDLPFRASRFRPLVSRKTDISVFKAMLKPTEVNA